MIKHQLLIADGQKLSISQDDVHFKGHALECRINAEDAATFVPSPGMVSIFHPPGGPGIRLDTHIYQGYEVPPYYDSMIGKLIAHGETRDAALARMETALDETVIEGVATNIDLHRELVNDPVIQSGGAPVTYLERRLGLA